MKKLIVLLGLLAILFVVAAGCISADVPAVNNSTTDPIVGIWQSTQTFTSLDGEEVYYVYEILADNTGFAYLVSPGSDEGVKSAIYWGNDKGTYVFALSTSTDAVYYHYLSADEKTLTDAAGNTYTRI
ncbi:MAG: hypothetical protein Q7J08_02775 [Methanocorpusculum sp.]|uniref:hypothetical protein n=1 Tax=Methanocorpusculum sp. TaxID=2058474 RepID=UPI00271EAEAE|nr:hypothetical protein [Methanocorpusculum sp.]MDO9522617.1 hypothetical protein [Methanocorpusculum sp.]